jgi:predicted RNase H-like HicB family nuclease
MYRFLVIYEKGNQNYSAYLPDLPGCVAVGDSLEDVKKGIREAIKLHLEGMIEDQEPIPPSQTMAEYVDVAIPDPAA